MTFRKKKKLERCVIGKADKNPHLSRKRSSDGAGETGLETTSPPSPPPIFPSFFILSGKIRDLPGWKELSELRQRQAQMQTRLPARLPAPKLLSLAHVISLEQSRERAEERRRGRSMAEGLELGVGVLILVRAGVRDLAQGFCFTRQRERERSRERSAHRRSCQG